MTARSGHRPTQRLVSRPSRGVMPEENLFEHQARVDAEQPAVTTRPDKIQERFDIWIANNPQVLRDFIALARAARDRGKTRVGAKLICEVLRWETFINGDEPSDDGFKLNNIYTSRLARLAAQTAPDIAPMFEFRPLTSA